MKFKLTTAGRYYSKPEARARLESLGFLFHYERGDWCVSDPLPVIEIETIGDLLALCTKVNESIVFDWLGRFGEENTIIIYDDYLE